MATDSDAIRKTADHFQFQGQFLFAETYGAGHINRTFAVYYAQNDGSRKRYILQHINKTVFAKPVELMENVEHVTAHLQSAIRSRNGDPERESLTLIPSASGQSWYQDPDGEYWRAYVFIEKTICLQIAQGPADLYHAARGFGKFQMLLDDFPAGRLHETIAGFHDTPRRYRAFLEAIDCDAAGRAASVQTEIEFVMSRKDDSSIIMDAIKSGGLPLRVTHNDTKLNNVMLDLETGEEVCVIDLDTVMPGSSLFDYGDAIRSGATTGLEDEKDLGRVSFDLEKARAFTLGFLETAGAVLSGDEIAMLPWGAKLMTFECGMRFLTDYLNGDKYFRIHRPEHNLDRCRTQFKMVADMEHRWAEYNRMVDEIRETFKASR